jgi:HEAT repeat protein
MNLRSLFRGKKGLTVLALLLVLAAVAWINRTPLLSWYYLRGLAAAGEEDRASWAECVAGLDEAALPELFEFLERPEPGTCANAEAALACLGRRWGNSDVRSLRLLEQLAERFARFSVPGREAVLELAIVTLRPGEGQPPPAEPGIALLNAAAPAAEQGVRSRALALAETLAGRAAGRWPDLYRDLVRKGLAADDADGRVRAARLTLQPPLRNDASLLASVVPLLRDARPEVRRAALLAVGLAEQTIREDDLLPLLHDSDADVRRLCEAALRGRGLQESHLRLARLISNPEPSARLQVLRHLHEAEDLEPGVWLRRLSHDPDWAVRVAAMRAAAENPQVDLSDRLRAMRDSDPSETVRQLAAYYLQRRPARPR